MSTKSPDALAAEGRIIQAQERIKNPVSAIRAKCIDCAGGEPGTVKNCEHSNCALYLFRFGKDPYRGREKPENYRPVLKAIRAECLACNGSAHEVRLCPSTDCALHSLRFGKNPFRAEKPRERGQSTEEQSEGVS